ncbi:MAG: fibronectin type III domain-containing protein [Coriobacteriales bacterium]|jgi:hypothetical protein|nr:fibronectin type III domain-containing protein [Coriobacteriales bacterium]
MGKARKIVVAVQSAVLSLALVLFLNGPWALGSLEKKQAFADGPVTSGEWAYLPNATGITLMAYTGRSLICRVPATVDNLTVTEVGSERWGSILLPRNTLRLDTSNCGGSLQALNCDYDGLSSINVSNNPNLQYLSCASNYLATLNLRRNPNLKELNCSLNRLRALNLAQGLNLEKFYCDNNMLTSINVASDSNLSELHCSDNKLTSLDVSNNLNLEELDCDDNQIRSLDLRGNALLYLRCSQNLLTSLDLSACENLRTLECSGNSLTALDVSNNPDLNDLECSEQDLRSLDLSRNPALAILYCGSVKLDHLDLSHNSALVTLYCDANQLTALDLSHCPQLGRLYCDDNKITALDLSHNLDLTWVDCSDNRLRQVDVARNRRLLGFVCDRNLIYNVSTVARRFGYDSAMPQSILTDIDPHPAVKDFRYQKKYNYNGKPRSAKVSAAPGVWGMGRVTTYYKAQGSSRYSTVAPKAAGRYDLYVKTTQGSHYYARNSYLRLGGFQITPRGVSKLRAKAGSNKLTLSWKNYSTSADNVSSYRVYYRKAGSGKWRYKTLRAKKAKKTTLKLADKKKYYLKVQVCHSSHGRTLASHYSATVHKKTK